MSEGNHISRYLDADIERMRNLPKEDQPTESFFVGVEYAANKVHRSDYLVMSRDELKRLVSNAFRYGATENSRAQIHPDAELKDNDELAEFFLGIEGI